MQRLDDAAVRQGAAGDGRTVEVHRFQPRAPAQIHRLGQVRAVSHIDGLHQHIVAQIQLRQVRVGVGARAVAQLQALELGRHAEFRIAHLQTAQVPDVLDLACGIHIDLRVVHIVQRALQLIAAAPQRPGLHQIAAVLHRGVDVRIWRHRDVALGIATQGDHIRQAVPGVVLAVHVPEPVVQPPLPLLRLAALEHPQIGADAVGEQRLQILEVAVLVEDGLRPLLLVGLKPGLRVRVAQLPLAPQRLVHAHQLRAESLTQVLPENALLAVEHIRRAYLVDVLQGVVEHQRALVVGADGRVHIVGQPAPHIPAHSGGEGVLCPGVHHQEQLGEQVIEQRALQLHMVPQLRLELGKPFRLFLRRVHGALVRALQPGSQRRQVGGNGVAIRVSRLKVVHPVRAGEIVALPQHPVAGVVQGLPALVPVREAEHFRRALVVVEVVLPDELRTVSGVLEHHNRIAVDALPHRAVRLLGRRLIGTRFVVELHQLHIVCALAGCHIRLESEGVRGHAVIPQLILGIGGGSFGKATVELDLVVLPGIGGGGSALHIDLCPREAEAPVRVHRVRVTAGDGFLVSLVLR